MLRRRLRSSKQRPNGDVVVSGEEEMNNEVRTYNDDYDQEEDARNVNRNNKQMRFNHVLMSGDRKRTTSDGGGRYVNSSKRSPQHEDVQHDDRRGRSENILNSVQVQINNTPPPPSRHQPRSQSHTSPTHTTATTTSTTFNRQERARQKLDNLSRQHQLHQYEQQRRFHNHQNTFTTDGEEGEGTTTDYSVLSRTTADTSDTTTLQLQSNYDSLMNSNYSSNIYRIPIISTAATCGIEENIITPRIPISCNNDDGNTAESSYYSKHDFHTLPRTSLNELEADGNNEIDNNATAVLREKQQKDVKKHGINRQAYHCKSLVGRKLLDNVKDIVYDFHEILLQARTPSTAAGICCVANKSDIQSKCSCFVYLLTLFNVIFLCCIFLTATSMMMSSMT